MDSPVRPRAPAVKTTLGAAALGAAGGDTAAGRLTLVEVDGILLWMKQMKSRVQDARATRRAQWTILLATAKRQLLVGSLRRDHVDVEAALNHRCREIRAANAAEVKLDIQPVALGEDVLTIAAVIQSARSGPITSNPKRDAERRRCEVRPESVVDELVFGVGDQSANLTAMKARAVR